MGSHGHTSRRPRGRRLAERYGWRAYALPILVVVTVVALLHVTRSSAPAPAHTVAANRSPVAPSTRPTARVPVGGPAQFESLPADYVPCSNSAQPRLILVSISRQRVWMCAGTTQVYSSLVTTGAANVGDGTPLGTWQVQAKQTDRYLVGPGYRDYVHFWMPFDGDFGFHDAPWQTMPYGSPGYRANGSHGCVHLPGAAMRWLFGWAQIGTTVTITD